MALTTLLGTAQLELQDALRRGATSIDGRLRVPNFVTVGFRRADFIAEFGADDPSVRERLRRDLEGGVRRFVEASAGHLAGNGQLVLNVLPRVIDDLCRVQARSVQALALLRITDDRGSRDVEMTTTPAIVGRERSDRPAGFLPIADGLSLVSREHLELRYRDLELSFRLLGRNPTTLDGSRLEREAWTAFPVGGRIRCGACEIALLSIT